VAVSGWIPAYLLKERKVETFHQVGMLHVTAQVLGLLDHLPPALCRVVILARIWSDRPEFFSSKDCCLLLG
jgi:hypothetical protein